MMEIGFIPCKTSILKQKVAKLVHDDYTDSMRYELSLPLRGVWLQGEFSLARFNYSRLETKAGEKFVLLEEQRELQKTRY